MTYRIRYGDEAGRALPDGPGRYRQRLRRLIGALAEDPCPANAKPLRDRPGRYRVRLDNWRVVYEVDDDAGVVFVIRVKIKKGTETYEAMD